MFDYLRYTNNLVDAHDARQDIMKLYQHLITKFHDEGSYDLWGAKSNDFWTKSQKTTSVWLTAYVTKILIQAMQRKAIDQNQSLVKKSLDYLKGKAGIDGTFTDDGYSKNHYEGYDPLNSKIYTTAFVLIAFLQYKELFDSTEYNDLIKKGTEYLEEKYDNADNLAAAISINTFDFTNLEKFETNIESLNRVSHNHGSKTYYFVKTKQNNQLNVIMSSYVALAYLKIKKYHKAKPIINWLLDVRKFDNDFFELHDTALAMEAITELAKVSSITVPNFEFDITSSSLSKTLFVNKTNMGKQQYVDIPPYKDELKVKAVGKGFLLIDLICYQYKTAVFDNEMFNIEVTTKKNSYNAVIDIKLKYTPPNDENIDEMVIMEVQLQSGFVYEESNNDFKNHPYVKVPKNFL